MNKQNRNATKDRLSTPTNAGMYKEKTVILSDDAMQTVGDKLYETLRKKHVDVQYISVSNMDVKPCYNCGSCTCKTFGRCVVRDDGDKIYKELIKATTWIIVTPITWGAYSFLMKRVLDKLALIGDRHYYVKGKELVKRMKHDLHFYVIGIKEKCSLQENEVFQKLVRENLSIMSAQGEGFVLEHELSQEGIVQIARKVSR